MARRTDSFVCQNCGAHYGRWQGKCDACGEWNTIAEEGAERVAAGPGKAPRKGRRFRARAAVRRDPGRAPARLRHCRIRSRHRRRLRARLGAAARRRPRHRQVDAADPGRRNAGAAPSNARSIFQAKRRSRRCGCAPNGSVSRALRSSLRLRLRLKTSSQRCPRARPLASSSSTRSRPCGPTWSNSAPGTVTQVRGSAQMLIRFAKRCGAAVILVGHVTKDGQIAGPRVVEHMVDAVMSFEGEGSHQFRILRAVKNRFGPTDEIGVFEMTGAGLREVANPSELFLSERDLGSPGTAVFAGIEGSRPLLVEMQALVAPTSLGTPRRAVVGWDQSRLSMLLAVLEAHCGVQALRPRRLSQCRRRASHPGARRRSRRRRRAGVVARPCAAAGRRGVLRRGLAVGRGAAGGADRGAAQGGGEARLRPRRHAGGVTRRRRRLADARNRRLAVDAGRRHRRPRQPRGPSGDAAPQTNSDATYSLVAERRLR